MPLVIVKSVSGLWTFAMWWPSDSNLQQASVVNQFFYFFFLLCCGLRKTIEENKIAWIFLIIHQWTFLACLWSRVACQRYFPFSNWYITTFSTSEGILFLTTRCHRVGNTGNWKTFIPYTQSYYLVSENAIWLYLLSAKASGGGENETWISDHLALFGWFPVHCPLFQADNGLFLLQIRILLVAWCWISRLRIGSTDSYGGPFYCSEVSIVVLIDCNNISKVFLWINTEVVLRDTLSEMIGNIASWFGFICLKNWNFPHFQFPNLICPYLIVIFEWAFIVKSSMYPSNFFISWFKEGNLWNLSNTFMMWLCEQFSVTSVIWL